MSVVERAIKKLQKGRSPPADRPAPIARIIEAQEAADAGSGSHAARKARRAAAGRYIEIDFQALRDAEVYSAENQGLADEYRAIKQPLLKRASGLGAGSSSLENLVMVASSLSGEGKTFTSFNLSMSLALEKDWEVLLIDADCRKPHLSRLLGVVEQQGLLDLLRNPEMEISDVILATNIEGLSILPLGVPDENSAELLASAQMEVLCKRLSSGNAQRIVIFDSSPLLLTAEAPILSGHVGQVVMVVQANKTLQQAVMQSISKLDPSKAIGLVLNRADRSGDGHSYGYGYGYGSGAPLPYTSDAVE